VLERSNIRRFSKKVSISISAQERNSDIELTFDERWILIFDLFFLYSRDYKVFQDTPENSKALNEKKVLLVILYL